MNKTLVSIFRPADLGDCTGHGLSSRVDSANLFWNCDRREAMIYCEKNNIDANNQFILVKRELWGEDHSYAEPLVKPIGKNQCFGGNFIYTSNGNFYKMYGLRTSSPIPIHDRFEDYN